MQEFMSNLQTVFVVCGTAIGATVWIVNTINSFRKETSDKIDSLTVMVFKFSERLVILETKVNEHEKSRNND